MKDRKNGTDCRHGLGNGGLPFLGVLLLASLSAMGSTFKVGIITGNVHSNEFNYIPQKATDGWEFRTYPFYCDVEFNELKGKLFADLSNDLDMVVFSPLPPETLIDGNNPANLDMWQSFIRRGGIFAVTDGHELAGGGWKNWWNPLLQDRLGWDYRAYAYSYSGERPNVVVDAPDHPHHPFRDFPSAQIDGMNVWAVFARCAWAPQRGLGENWEWVDDWTSWHDYGPSSILSRYDKGTLFLTTYRKPYFTFFENLRAFGELHRVGLKVVRSDHTGFSNNLERVSFTVANVNKTASSADDFTVTVLAKGYDGTSCSSNFTGRVVADGLEFSFNFLNTVHGDGTLKVWLVGRNGEEAVIIDRKQTFDDVIVPLLPRYRSRVSTCRRRSEVQLGFRVNPAYVREQAETWTAWVLDASGRVWWQETGDLAVGETGKSFWADVSKSAPAGDYTLAVSVCGSFGELAGSGKFKIVAPTESQVMIDQNNVLLRGGKPWLPIGLYGCRATTENDWSERIWKLGVDLQHILTGCHELPRFGKLGEMKQPALAELNPKLKTVENCADLARDLSQLACGGMICTEDEPTDPDIPHWEEVYKAMAEAAPDNPVYFATRYPTSARYQSGIADIMASSWYSGDVTWTSFCIDVMREQMGDSKPVFAVINPSNVEYEAKFRVAAFLSLVHGAKGLLWYEWGTVKGYPIEGWFPRLVSDVRRLEPYLLSLRTKRLSLAGGTIHALDCGDYRTGRKLICVNPTDAPVTVTEAVEGFATPFTVPAMDMVTLDEQVSAAADLRGAMLELDPESPWTVDTSVSKAGGSSLRSGAVREGESSVFMDVEGSGTLSFWWRKGDAGTGAFFVDGEQRAAVADGSADGRRVELLVSGSGVHHLRWTFTAEDGQQNPDAGLWLDLVQWVSSDVPRFTETTPQPVPYSWLTQHGLANDCDFEAAARKVGEKGVPAWSEYVAGTDPADPKSRFIATIDVQDGKVNLSWEPPNPAERWADDTRFYSVLGAETLEGDVKWEPAETSRHHFFKIGIDVRPH